MVLDGAEHLKGVEPLVEAALEPLGHGCGDVALAPAE
jgi:hypothetical protein